MFALGSNICSDLQTYSKNKKRATSTMFLPLQMGTNYQGGTDFLRLAKPMVAGLTKQLKNERETQTFMKKYICISLILC